MGFESLRERIKETYGTQAAFARRLGVMDTTLGTRLNGLSEWKDRDIKEVCRLLDIPLHMAHRYFFSSAGRQEIPEKIDYQSPCECRGSDLRERIIDAGLTNLDLAEMIRVSDSTLYKRFRDGGGWTLREMEEICKVLEIRPEEMHFYFLGGEK